MYIVTGGAGFIGSVLVNRLNSEGIEDIIIVDELEASDKWKNLQNQTFAHFVHKDQFLEKLRSNTIPDVEDPRSIQGIIHLGACSYTTEKDMDFLMENNVHYSQALANFAVQHGIRFIYASSGSTYGAGELGYDDDDALTPKLRPLHEYGYSKQLFDVWVLRKGYQNNIAGLKFFNVYGPNEYHKGSKMFGPVKWGFDQATGTGTIRLFKSYHDDYKDGEQLRDFIYVKDCADAMWWLLQNPEVNGICNLGTGKARSWNDVARAIFDALGKKESIEYIDMRPELRNQYQYFTEAKMDKLRGFGYSKEFTSVEDGVRDYVQNYLMGESPYL